MLVDFHMHSIFSDGVETPKDLLQHAIDCNVSMMALTDHDEIDGIQALRAAQKKLDPNESIKIVNGCEFSADYKDKSIHILGYCFDENNKDLIDFITFFKGKREERIDEIIRRCNNEGYYITKEELIKQFPDTKAYGRPHIGKLLIDGGYAKDINDVFKGILRKDSPCYVPKVKVEVPYIIDIIHKAVERYKEFAKKHKLFITGGSDYHGIVGKKPDRFGDYLVSGKDVSEFISLL